MCGILIAAISSPDSIARYVDTTMCYWYLDIWANLNETPIRRAENQERFQGTSIVQARLITFLKIESKGNEILYQ